MNISELVLLGLICVTPRTFDYAPYKDQFVQKIETPEYREIASEQYGLCNITVFETSKNGCHYGYRFSFFGLPSKAVIVAQPIPEITYDADSYQCSKQGALSIDAIFTNCHKPSESFVASFVHWNGGIYVVKVPVEEKRVHRHELD